MIATLANSSWKLLSLPRAAAFRSALRNPTHVQQQLLRSYLRKNANTTFGRAHHFDSITSIADYQQRVPITCYDDYQPYIDRIMDGERAVLTADPVLALIPSSGSTQASKLIPYTRTLQREFNRAIAPWIVDLYRQYPDLTAGPAYWSISPIAFASPNRTSAIPIGFDEDSGYLSGLARPLIDTLMAVPGQIRFVQDVDSFRYITLLHLLNAPGLRLISVWHPSFLTLLLDSLPRFWPSLLRDLACGAVTPPSELPPNLARSLQLKPHRKRSAELEHLDPSSPSQLWPHLRLISCWADAHARLHLPAIQRLFPHATLQPKGLIATEAFISLPCAHSHPLAVRSHFFEFLDDAGAPHTVDDLQISHTYRIIITTGGGLYRYRLGDTIRVTGRIDATPTIEFLGREDSVCDHCGEKLSEGFVAAALQRTFAQLHLTPLFALLAPDHHNNHPGYTLFVEAPTLPAGLANTLDRELRANPHYDYCLRLGQLTPVKVFHIREAGYATFTTRCTSAGQRLGNIKPSALSPHPDWSGFFIGHYLNQRVPSSTGPRA